MQGKCGTDKNARACTIGKVARELPYVRQNRNSCVDEIGALGKMVYMSYLQWDSGGYADVHGDGV
jgi:hypothetical protein